MTNKNVAAFDANDALVGTELFYADGLVSAVAADSTVTATQIKTFCSASPTLVTPTLGVAAATSVTASAMVKITPVAVADLPGSPATGMVASVNDALAPVAGAEVADSGSATALVWYNGTQWTVIGV